MSESVRLYRYQSILGTRRAVPTQEFLDELEISIATFKRDIAKLRDQLGMPITFDRERGGYLLEADGTNQLPGMWFTPQELVALATLQQLLAQLQPGMLAETLEPIKRRLANLLQRNGYQEQAMPDRVRIAYISKREVRSQSLEAVASATIRRMRLQFVHFNRIGGDRVEREVSPQRLVLYRDHWYLDAWCHLRGALRSFAVAAIEAPQVLETEAIEMPAQEIDAIVYPSYGTFSGRPKAWAKLRFIPERSRWVSKELWHPQQEGRSLPDGSYELSIPYSDDRELLGDILRFGPEVKVLSPRELQQKVQQRLLAAMGRYVDEE
jgi:predicted DNA-binding transcriptional regulator YafY